ncbi:MAG: 50S ribosomal protein L7/L12, partial [Clostridia bacterium]|nr:50S ribosomal protein L7/L12 [Clostridia bacterium]
MTEKVANILDMIKTLNLLEVKELVDGICEEFGVSAAAAVAVAAAPAAAAAEDEKTEFDVVLKGAG